jgi:hypothetical protein
MTRRVPRAVRSRFRQTLFGTAGPPPRENVRSIGGAGDAVHHVEVPELGERRDPGRARRLGGVDAPAEMLTVRVGAESVREEVERFPVGAAAEVVDVERVAVLRRSTAAPR